MNTSAPAQVLDADAVVTIYAALSVLQQTQMMMLKPELQVSMDRLLHAFNPYVHDGHSIQILFSGAELGLIVKGLVMLHALAKHGTILAEDGTDLSAETVQSCTRLLDRLTTQLGVDAAHMAEGHRAAEGWVQQLNQQDGGGFMVLGLHPTANRAQA